jgi:cobalt-zinc-cadmium efflux system outer membrane protein
MKELSFALLAGLFWLGISHGQAPSATGRDVVATPSVLTLDEAIHLALKHNPELRIAGARVEAAAGRAVQARQWTNPELELSAEDWPVSNGRGFSDAKQTIGIAQVLPFPGKKSLDGQIGGASVKLSEAELAVRRADIIRGAKAAFFRVLAAERLVEVATQLVVMAETSVTTARKRVTAGAAAYHEQLRAEVQLEQTRTEWTGYQRELAGARQLFATVLGRPDVQKAALAGTLAEMPDATLLEDASAEWLFGHPGMSAAQTRLERAQLEQRRARLEPYPDLKVGVSGGRIGETDQSIVQLGISLPLPLLDRGKGKQQEAQALVSEAEAELRFVQQQLQRDWAEASQRYRAAADQVASYRERILPKATEALRLIQTGFEHGKFTFLELVDTQRMTAEARLAYQGKLLEMNLAQAELEALLQLKSHQSSISK